MSDHQFVIAGNYREYFIFLESKGLPRNTQRYTFISDPMRLYGMRDIAVLSVGTYWLSPVFAMKESLTDRGINFVTSEGKIAL